MPPRRGEVWLFDFRRRSSFGVTGRHGRESSACSCSERSLHRYRSCLLASVVFHTTTLRGSQFEVKIQVPFLKEGAFVDKASPPIRSLAQFASSARSMRLSLLESKPPCSNGLVDLREHEPLNRLASDESIHNLRDVGDRDASVKKVIGFD